ncbi:MAG: DUF3078 domain-containing protein [bacterium]
MKKLSYIAIALIITSTLSASPWTLSVDANLTLTQNAYSNNWAGGEAGLLAWALNSNSLAEKQLSPKLNNKNTLKLAFGQIYNQDQDTKEWLDPVKSTDLIDFESVLRFTLGGFVDPFASARLETQFLDVSDTSKNRIFNPINLTEAIGVAKVLVKAEKRELTSRLGFGLKQIINREVLVDTHYFREGRRVTQTTNYGGITFVTDFNTPLAQEKITYTGKLSIFEAVFYSEADELKGLPNENYWQYPDVNWENIFTASITKYLMVNLYLQLLYDKEIDDAVRLKETMGLGLTFKLI